MVSYFEKAFSFELLTPTACLCRIDAAYVVFPAADGYVGVLSQRAPLIAMLGAGRVKVKPVSGITQEFYIAGGFAHVREDRLTILAEEGEGLEQLDAEQAWEELQSARKMLHQTKEQLAERYQAIATARVKFSLAHRKRKQRKQA